MSSVEKEKLFPGESFGTGVHEARRDRASCLQGACEAEAVLPRLVGLVTHKHEGKPFVSMQGEASCQGSTLGLLGWRQYLLEDYSRQMFPRSSPTPLHVHSGVTKCPLPGEAALSLAWLPWWHPHLH